MDLLLWRHAQAVDVNSTLDDLQRPLTQHGEAQAERMAAWLKRRLPAHTRILCSPALRTRQTVQYLTDKDYEICPLIAPNASVQDLLQAAQWPTSDNDAAEQQGESANATEVTETTANNQAQATEMAVETAAKTDADAAAETAADKKTKNNKRAVLIVGHQPTLGLVAQQLLHMQAPCAIKKGALWWLRHRVRNGQAQVVLVAVLNPQML